MIKIFDKKKIEKLNDPKYKRLYEDFSTKLDDIQSNLGALVNINKDFTDNHKFNALRAKLIKRGII